MKRLAIVSLLAAGVVGAQAETYIDNARVRSIDPQYENISAPRNECTSHWVSEGGLNHVCERLNVPPADAWGVATFYALIATTPRPKRVVHVCDDVVCRVNGGTEVAIACRESIGPAHEDEVDLR